MLVNLATLPVFPQQTPEDTHPPQPHHLGGHTGLGGTLSLTGAGVATEALGGVHVARTGARGGVGGLDDAVGSVAVQTSGCRIGLVASNPVSHFDWRTVFV